MPVARAATQQGPWRSSRLRVIEVRVDRVTKSHRARRFLVDCEVRVLAPPLDPVGRIRSGRVLDDPRVDVLGGRARSRRVAACMAYGVACGELSSNALRALDGRARA
jgi:hypothetical protein